MEYSVQDIFNKFGNIYLDKYNDSYLKNNVFNNIIECRTKKMGVNIYKCSECGKEIYTYKSCMNRHCPNCLNYKKELWIEKHKNDILDIKYYHIVLCIPKELYPLCYYNQLIMYDLLFKISSDIVLETNYQYLGINVGITSILHTWSQKGKYYPHIHMLVTGGGINKIGKWEDSELVSEEIIRTRFKNKLLNIVKKLRLNFYGKFGYLNHYDYYIKHINNIDNNKFICYKKEPYNSVKDIYEYFAKYAFRVWISNERIKNIDDKYVYFSYKDYNDKNKDKICRIKGEEFIRRFLTHTLTKNFVKIRYYGIMSCKNKTNKIKKLKIITKTKKIKDKLISKIELLKKILNKDINKCSKCNGKLVLYKEIKPNKGPPKIKNKDILVKLHS